MPKLMLLQCQTEPDLLMEKNIYVGYIKILYKPKSTTVTSGP